MLWVVSFVVIHWYVPLGKFGVAVSWAVSPKQMLALLTVNIGVGFTVTRMSSVPTHPFHVYNTLYMLVVLGLTVIVGVVWPVVQTI
jgi:hypothetical protein